MFLEIYRYLSKRNDISNRAFQCVSGHYGWRMEESLDHVCSTMSDLGAGSNVHVHSTSCTGRCFSILQREPNGMGLLGCCTLRACVNSL